MLSPWLQAQLARVAPHRDSLRQHKESPREELRPLQRATTPTGGPSNEASKVWPGLTNSSHLAIMFVAYMYTNWNGSAKRVVLARDLPTIARGDFPD